MLLMIDARSGATGSVDEWMERFGELWRGGRARLDDFMSLFGPGIRLAAPGLAPTVGHAAGREAFRRTFDVFPDMVATIHGWAAGEDVMFAEMTFTATIGGRSVSWRGVDRFRIEDGVVVERLAYFNQLRIRRALLANPRGWMQLARLLASGLGK